MKAVGYRKSGPLNAAEPLVDVELPKPVPAGRDLCVAVKAISVNPVDTKVRRRADPEDGGVKQYPVHDSDIEDLGPEDYEDLTDEVAKRGIRRER